METLVAVDWNGQDIDPQPVIDFLGDALITYEDTTQPHYRTGKPLRAHRFTFDTSKVRNTHAHSAGFRAGFVVHLEETTR